MKADEAIKMMQSGDYNAPAESEDEDEGNSYAHLQKLESALPPPGSTPSKPYVEPGFTEKFAAMLEAGGGMVTSLVSAIPAVPYGVVHGLGMKFNHIMQGQPTGDEVQDSIVQAMSDFTPDVLMPKTPLSQAYFREGAKVLAGMPVMGAEGNVMGAASKTGARVVNPVAAQITKQFAKLRKPKAQVDTMTPLSQLSEANGTSRDLHAMITQNENDGIINPIVARRHIEADSLPSVTDEAGNILKIRLTKGMATQDSELLSKEKNARAQSDPVRKIMDDNGKAFPLVLDKFQNDVAPDINFRNNVEEGQFYIDKLQDLYSKLHTDTGNKYQALYDAAAQNGLGNTPLDAGAFANDVANRFNQFGLMHEDLPPSVRLRVEKVASGELPLTFQNFENLRTILGREQRKAASSSSEGSASAAYAIGQVRESLENMPLTPEAQQLKPLADAARKAAKFNFDLQEKTPAYKAAVSGDVRPDDFVQKYILGTNKNTGVESLRNFFNLFPQDNDFNQALAWSTLKDIKNQATTNTGAVTTSKLNKVLTEGQETGKHEMLLPKPILHGLDNLNKTVQLVQGAPAGNYIQGNPNVSAWMSHWLGSGLYKMAARTPVIGGPISGMADVFMGLKDKAKAAREAHEHTKTGAGLDWPIDRTN